MLGRPHASVDPPPPIVCPCPQLWLLRCAASTLFSHTRLTSNVRPVLVGIVAKNPGVSTKFCHVFQMSKRRRIRDLHQRLKSGFEKLAEETKEKEEHKRESKREKGRRRGKDKDKDSKDSKNRAGRRSKYSSTDLGDLDELVPSGNALSDIEEAGKADADTEAETAVRLDGDAGVGACTGAMAKHSIGAVSTSMVEPLSG